MQSPQAAVGNVGKLPPSVGPYPIQLNVPVLPGLPGQRPPNVQQVQMAPATSGVQLSIPSISSVPSNYHKVMTIANGAPRTLQLNVKGQPLLANPIQFLQQLQLAPPQNEGERPADPEKNPAVRAPPRPETKETVMTNTLQFSGGQFHLVANPNVPPNPVGNAVQIKARGKGVYYIQTAGTEQPANAETAVGNVPSIPSTPSPIIVRKPMTGGIQIIRSVQTNKAVAAPKNMPIAPKGPQSLIIQKTNKNPPIAPPKSISLLSDQGNITATTTAAVQENQPIYFSARHLSNPKMVFQKLAPQKITLNNKKLQLPSNLYNIQIKNGQILNDPHNSVTVLGPISKIPPLHPLNKKGPIKPNQIQKVSAEDAPTDVSPEGSAVPPPGMPGTRVEPISEKEYTISIPESDVTMNEDTYTVSITDSNSMNSSNETSFTIPIPEKGISLLCKNSPGIDSTDALYDAEDGMMGNTIPAILRRSNSENNDKKSMNARRRMSLCNESEGNSKLDTPKIKSIPEEGDETKVPSLYCNEEMDAEPEKKGLIGHNLPPSLEIVSKTTQSVIATKDRRKSRMSSDIVQTKGSNKEMCAYDLKNNASKAQTMYCGILDDKHGLLLYNNGLYNKENTKMRFELNEFGLVNFLDKGYKSFKENNGREKKLSSPDDMLQCLECGCHGLEAEFVSHNFCSVTCKLQYDKSSKAKKEKMLEKYKKKVTKPRKPFYKKTVETESKPNEEQTIHTLLEYDNFKASMIEEKTSLINDSMNPNPWICSKSGFSWMKYLDHCKATAAPEKFFKDSGLIKNSFKKGMKLEAIDPMRPSVFAVVTVADIQGHRLRLHFDGYERDFDFWVNMDSYDIFPAGWCEKNKHILRPPKNYEGIFSWSSYLKQSKAIAAPKNLFLHVTDSPTSSCFFKVGMKLEAEDKKNSLTCVATVVDIIYSRILIHFDSWDDIYDYWVDPTSPYVHPVGWCDENGYSLTPPNYCKDPESFVWEEYLKKTKSTAAPTKAFKPRQSHKFRAGMKIEAVDKRVPFLVRVATISDVRCYQVRVSFDGWSDEYSYWVDDDSPSIHPVGWCLKTGHSLEPPLTGDDLKQLGACGTPGCRGWGNTSGAQSTTHWLTEECPYKLPVTSPIQRDRLEGARPPAKHSEPRPREPRKSAGIEQQNRNNNVNKLNLIHGKEDFSRIQAMKSKESSPGSEELDLTPINNRLSTGTLRKSLKRKSDEGNRFQLRPADNYVQRGFKKKRSSLPMMTRENVERSVYEPGYIPNPNKLKPPFWGGVCLSLKEILQNDAFGVDPRNWSVRDVQRFVDRVTESSESLTLFSQHRIDGESFLMLAQDDLVQVLKLKLGPAMKIYNSIIYLRQKILS